MKSKLLTLCAVLIVASLLGGCAKKEDAAAPGSNGTTSFFPNVNI